MEPNPLSDLPPELFTAISQHGDTIPLSLSEVGSSGYNIADAEYLRNSCQRAISVKEVKNYLESAPPVLAIFSINTHVEEDYGQYFYFDNYTGSLHRYSGNVDKYLTKLDWHVSYMTYSKPGAISSPQEIQWLSDNNVNHADKLTVSFTMKAIPLDNEFRLTVTDMIKNFIVETGITGDLEDVANMVYPKELDFLSQYHIFSRRLGCRLRNPNYAKNQITAAIKFLLRNANTGRTKDVLNCYLRFAIELVVIGYETPHVVDYFWDGHRFYLKDGRRIETNENLQIFVNQINKFGKLLLRYYQGL